MNTLKSWSEPEQPQTQSDPNSLRSFLLEHGIRHVLDIRRTVNDHDQRFVDLTEIDNLVRIISNDANPHHRLFPLYAIASTLHGQSTGESPFIINGAKTKFTLHYASFHRGRYWITVSIHKKGSMLALTDAYTVADLREKIGKIHIPFRERFFEALRYLFKGHSLTPF